MHVTLRINCDIKSLNVEQGFSDALEQHDLIYHICDSEYTFFSCFYLCQIFLVN
jgi:hypothetical protein